MEIGQSCPDDGRNGQGSYNAEKVFQAFAVLAYNPQTQQLGMKAFTLEGRQTEAYFKVLEENKFEWGFDLPNGKAKNKIYHYPFAPVKVLV